MAAPDVQARSGTGAPLAPQPAARRALAWIYTGPIGHLWSTAADVIVLWARWGFASARRYSNR